MIETIHVVGLVDRSPATDWDALISGRVVVARHREVAEQSLPETLHISHAYDDWFERDSLRDIEGEIANDLIARSKVDPIAFIVPGPGWVGDAIVAALAALTETSMAPGAIRNVVAGQTQIVDALLLAQAEECAPFDAGTHALDATLPAEVYNLCGSRVTQLASARLKRIYGAKMNSAGDQTGYLHLAGRDPLDGPPSFPALEYITARLRRPDGCPWDRKQTHTSLLDDFASEVAEYGEAVDASDWSNAAEELGDVLLNVLMQVQIGTEAGHFRMEDVLTAINSKLVRRHPHVFAGIEATTPEEVLEVWNRVKAQEKTIQRDS